MSNNKPLVLNSDKPVGLCCDHAGFELKQYIIKLLEANNIEYKDFGTDSINSCDYADYAHPLATAVENGECYPGIAICGSGNGINMTLNKHQGIRSALCWAEELARLSRAHNNANIITLPARFISEDETYKALVAFFTTPFEGGRHQTRIDKIPCCK